MFPSPFPGLASLKVKGAFEVVVAIVIYHGWSSPETTVSNQAKTQETLIEGKERKGHNTLLRVFHLANPFFLIAKVEIS